jgi:phosphinothricin acetyltransferase
VIRNAAPDDARAVADIWNHYIRDTLVTFNFAEKSLADVATDITARQAQGHGFFVAQSDAGIVGFATYGQFRGGVGYAHTMEHTVQLHPDHFGGGVGRAIMLHTLDHAKAQGVHSMFAGVSSENPAGVQFHERLGFQKITILREVGRKFDQWLDLVLMQKML